MITENYEAYADGGTQKDFRISVVGEETVIENSNMLTESIKLDEALCSDENLRFGCCEASQFTVQVANVFDNFEGKNLAVTVTMDEETTKYGTFKVLSDKPTADRVWRTITAYDAMRDIINADVLEWYNALTFPMTIRAFRDSFFNHLGITQKAVTLINDSFEIKGGFSATGTLSGKTIISSICEFNGVFGHINRDGNFEYVSLDSASNFICPPYQNNSVTYEDYVTEAITKVTMRGSADDIGTSVGVDGNEYIIQNNPLIYGTEGTQTLITAITNLLNKISQVTFRPYSLGKTIGNPCVELGDSITISTRYQTINSYVIKRVLSGIQALRDNYSATGNKVYPKEVNSVQEQINRTQGKMNILSRTVDETVNTLIRVEQIAEGAQETADGLANDVATANQKAQTALNNSNKAIIADTLHYLATSQESGVTTSTFGWTTTTQSVTETNKYLWIYHTYTYADSHTADTTPIISGVYGDTGAKGDKGEDGDDGTSVSITSTSVTYQISGSGITVPSGTWQSSVPPVAQGHYLWTRTIVNYSNGTSTTAYSVSYQGQNGANGTSVTIVSQNVAYQVSSNGTTAPTGTWQSTPQPTSTGEFLWTRTIVNYSNGTSTISYSVAAHGSTGSQGATGVGIKEVTPLYYVSNSSTVPSAPTSEVTTTSTTSYNTWTKGIPALVSTYRYMYTCDQVKYTNNTFAWTTPVLNNALTDLTERVTTAEQKITPEAIISTVSTTYTTKTEFNNLQIGVRNLASKKSTILAFNCNPTITGYNYRINAGNGAGLKFPASMFTRNQEYVLSFKFKKVSGTLTAIGGHQEGFTCKGFYVDGVKSSNTYSNGQTVSNNTDTHTVVVYLKFNGNSSDNNLYIQPNRFSYNTNNNVFDIWDIQIENGNKATDWTPAPEDVEQEISTVESSVTQLSNQIVLKVKADGTIAKVSLNADAGTGSKVLIKGDNIQLDGNVTITSGFVLNAGVIQSQNYVANTSGMKITLTDGVIDTKNFKLSNTGIVTMTEAVINGSITFRDSIKCYDTAKGTTSTLLSMSVTQASSGIPSEYTLNFLDPGTSKAYLIVGSARVPYFDGIASFANGNVDKTGDTMSGNLSIKGTTDTPLYIYGTGSDVFIGLGQKSSNTINGYLYIRSNGKAGSYYSGAYHDFLEVTGGTVNGTVNVTRLNLTGWAGFMDLGSNNLGIVANNGLLVRKWNNTNTYAPVYASSFSQQSSRLVKENIQPITESEAKKLLKLETVSFDYIKKVGGNKNQRGMIAEDVLKIYPELVNVPENYSEEKAKKSIYEGNNTETLGLDYAKFTPYLIKMIQIHQRQIDELKQSNNFYQNIILQMQAEIEQIKQKTEE